jgi:hypothetical protein
MRTHSRATILFVSAVAVFLPTTLSAMDLASGTVNIREDTSESSWAYRFPDTIPYPLIPWPVHYGVQQTGQIDASFNCYGQIGAGFGNAPSTPYPGWTTDVNFESPSSSGKRYMFAGAIWVGGVVGPDTLVSVGADGWQAVNEMNPPRKTEGVGSVTWFPSRADYSMRAEFVDTFPSSSYEGPHRPLHLKMANRSYAWNNTPYNRTILYDLVITNIGSDFIHGGYVGFLMDGDVYEMSTGGQTGAQDDVTGFLSSDGIAYIIDNDGDPSGGTLDGVTSVPRAFAFRVLSSSMGAGQFSYNWWVSNGNPTFDFGPQTKAGYRDLGTGGTGTPEGDRNKYAFLRNGEIDYDQVMTGTISPSDPIWMSPSYTDPALLSRGRDTRFLVSIGPFDLPPQASMRVLYATFTGDSVHVMAYNGRDNLLNAYNPATYLANLHFDDLLANAARSDSLAESLLFATDPVVGLEYGTEWADSAAIEWDPWVYPEVEGYNVYVTELDEATFPHPGVIPPWTVATPTSPNSSGDLIPGLTLTGLSADKYYAINVASRTASDVGAMGQPLLFPSGSLRRAAPAPNSDYVITTQGQLGRFSWTAPAGMTVDHYNIYRFPDSLAAKNLLHPFYDNGYAKVVRGRVPADSISIDGTLYYYYETIPYTVVDGGLVGFADYAATEGTAYVVSAVDVKGFESQFSRPVILQISEPKTKEILLVTNSTPSPSTGLVRKDTIFAFYQSILQNHQYDIYSYNDSVYLNCGGSPNACFDWHLLSRYSLIIIDDEMKDVIPLSAIEDSGAQVTKYLLSGGKLAYFGSFRGFRTANVLTAPASYYGMAHPYLQRFFGIDSVYDVGAAYYYMNATPPFVDTTFGFRWAEAEDAMLPNIGYDTTSYPFYVTLQNYWPVGTPPSVSVFKTNDSGTVTHRYRSLYPASSRLEGLPVGVKSTINGITTYAFGFHLWYMDHAAAAEIIDSLAGTGCCRGVVGNLDGDIGDIVDISDLMAMVDYLFFGASQPGCFGEADVDRTGAIDISDLQGLVDFLFFSASLANCQ